MKQFEISLSCNENDCHDCIDKIWSRNVYIDYIYYVITHNSLMTVLMKFQHNIFIKCIYKYSNTSVIHCMYI